MEPKDAHHEEIARLAFQIYEKEGRPEGKMAEHWARAERAIREQRVAVPPHSDAPQATKNIPQPD